MSKTTVFKPVWDQSIPADVSPDILGAITEDTLNSYLAAHRRYDSEKYKFSKAFTGNGKASFTIEVAVDAALRLELPPFQKGKEKLTKLVDFPIGPGIVGAGSAAADENIVRLFADSNTFHFSWTTSDGKSFDHELKKIKFRLDAQIQIATDGSKHNLKFQATALYIDQSRLQKMVAVFKEADPTCAEKLDALFLSMLQVIAAQVATKLGDTIEIPALDMGSISLYASALALNSKTVVLAASADISSTVKQAHAKGQVDYERVRRAFETDVVNAGGIAALVFDAQTLKRARQLDRARADALLLRSTARSPDQIWKDLPETKAVLASLPHRADGHKVLRRHARRGASGSVGLGVGVTERLLQALAANAVNIDQKNCTGDLDLGLIKGRACANVHVWNPEITVGPNGLTGQVDIDVWAGIEYWIKKVWDCSWSWDGPHQVGLGLTGAPRVTITTIKDRKGLSVSASFDLRGVNLKTGINPVVDKIIAALDPPFIAILQAILNTIAALLSFVVVPVRISVPGQATGLGLGEFETSQYLRGQAPKRVVPPAALNFLAVDCSADPVKT